MYAQDIQEQVCQRVGAFNVSANICEFYCKHMAHLRKAMPNMCHPNEGANFCASDQAYVSFCARFSLSILQDVDLGVDYVGFDVDFRCRCR